MATTIDFDFKQSYNLKSLYLKDLSVYDDRDSIMSLKVEFWDWKLGANNTEDINSYTKQSSDSDWANFWDDVLLGAYLLASSFGLASIADGSYWFRVTITDASNTYTSEVAAFGFSQEVENAYVQKHLAYDWTDRYKENDKDNYDIAKLSNWFEALNLSIQPGSLIGNFNTILSNIKKYLELD